MTAMIVEELARIPMSPHLAATLTRAADYAVAQAHAEVTLEHLLLSLAEDPEASIVLASSQVDLGRLAADVSDYLSRAHDMGAGGVPGSHISGDLRRILEAAAAAAQQGRRREINGAIVLAAIVGDGKSAAAHILRAQGLTFEEAIKALQRAVTAPRTEDVLANARERVQSRSVTPPAHEPPLRGEPAVRAEPAPVPQHQPSPSPHPASPQGFPEYEAAPAAKPHAAEQHAPSEGWAPSPPQGAPQQRPAMPGAQPQPGAAQGGGRIAIPRANHTPAPNPQTSFPAPPNARAPHSPAAGAPMPGGPSLPPPIPPGPSLDPSEVAPAYDAPTPSQAPWAEPMDTSLRVPASPPKPQRADRAPSPSIPAQQGAPRRRASGTPGPFPGPVAQVETGRLVENIPRKMRRGKPVVAEARIGRADLKALTEGLQGGGAAFQHDLVVTKAMSVRLRAPEGGFWIEPRSPETQWIENVLGLSSEEYATWRWTVTPRTSGKKQLQIIVSARTMGSDGMTADTALPDQVIDVKVGINYGETFRRLTGWVLAAVLGGVLARFGDGIFDLAQSVVTRIASGN